jgi:ankyrin repeat protein
MEAFRFDTAIRQGDEEEVLRLLDADPSLLEKTSFGCGPLYVAITAGELGVAKLLIERGANQVCGFGWFGVGNWTALHAAAASGHKDIGAFLLDHGAEAHSADSRGVTPLILAAGEGHLDIVKMLVEHMAPPHVESKDGKGKTALHHCAKKGKEEVVKALLDKGAQADSRDAEGATPLMVAAHEGHLGVLQMLLQPMGGKGLEDRDNQGKTALHLAARWGHAELVSFMLSKGVQPNIQDKNGMTPLMTAIDRHHMDVVQMLLEHLGEQGLEERDEKGRTALHLAAECRSLDEEARTQLVAELLKKGAQVNVKDKDGMTPLMMTIKARRMEMAVMLLEHMEGEGLEAKDEQGRTAMHVAAQWGQAELVAVLVSKGAQVDVKDKDGNTPLMMAIKAGRIEMARMLLEHMEGEGIEAKDEKGSTAIHLAAKCGRRFTDKEARTQLVAVLLSKGAQVDVKDKDGITPLMLAIKRADIEVAQVLLQHLEGEGLEARDKQGRTALHLTVSDRAHYDIPALKLLLEHGATANTKDGNGVTPLMNMVLRGSLTSVQLLVQHVGEQGLQERDQEGRTALHCAIGRSATLMWAGRYFDRTSLAMVQVLLEAGADPFITDREGRTPRALAMEIGLQRCGRMCEVRIHAIQRETPWVISFPSHAR